MVKQAKSTSKVQIKQQGKVPLVFHSNFGNKMLMDDDILGILYFVTFFNAFAYSR